MRTRRIVKWAGLAVCVLIAVAWVGSHWVAVICPVGGVDVALGGGSFVFSTYDSGSELPLGSFSE